MRPFFLSADGKSLPSKRYYDIASYLVTQLGFSFTVAPFILLSGSASLTCWSRVYFYTIITVLSSLAFFASPAKVALIKQLKKRNGEARPATQRTQSTDSVKLPHLGMPDDPGRDLDDFMEEFKQEVELRRRRGQSVPEGMQEAMLERVRGLQGTGNETRVKQG